MLGAPDGKSPIESNLRAKNELDSLLHRSPAFFACRVGNEGEDPFVFGNGVKDFQGPDHGSVIKGYVSMVTFRVGIPLGPSSILVLSFKQIANSPKSWFLEFVFLELANRLGQQANFRVSGPIVDSCVIFVPSGANLLGPFYREAFLSVVILGPATG